MSVTKQMLSDSFGNIYIIDTPGADKTFHLCRSSLIIMQHCMILEFLTITKFLLACFTAVQESFNICRRIFSMVRTGMMLMSDSRWASNWSLNGFYIVDTYSDRIWVSIQSWRGLRRINFHDRCIRWCYFHNGII